MVRRTPPTNLPGFGGFGGREHANKAINNYCPEANRFVWEFTEIPTHTLFSPLSFSAIRFVLLWRHQRSTCVRMKTYPLWKLERTQNSLSRDPPYVLLE